MNRHSLLIASCDPGFASKLGFVLIVLTVLLPTPVSLGQQRKLAEFGIQELSPNDAKHDNVTRPETPEKLYVIRFSSDDPFVFHVPKSLMKLSPSNALFAVGSELYSFDHDGNPFTRELSFAIPRKVIRIRDALLASRKFFSNGAMEHGFEYTRLTASDPMPVYVGYFIKTQTAGAITSTRANLFSMLYEMRFRHDVAAKDIEPYVAHEFFHVVQKKLHSNPWSFRRFNSRSDDVCKRFLSEMTATWASDAPIGITPTSSNGPNSVDQSNHWLGFCDRYMSTPTISRFFNRNYEYAAGLLVKYWAEQLGGGKDNQGLKHVYTLLTRIYDKGRATRDTIIETMGEMLPTDRYAGDTWQVRWTHFFRDFASANLVQKASSLNSPADRLGYHDDGLTKLGSIKPIQSLKKWVDDYSTRPTQLFAQPATTKAEQQRRLATIAVGSDTAPDLAVNWMTNTWHMIDLTGGVSGSTASNIRLNMESRPLFVYAKCDGDESHVTLIEQIAPDGDYTDRMLGTFRQSKSFTFWDGDQSSFVREVMTESPDASPGSSPRYQWIGFSNANAKFEKRQFRFAYLAPPRLVEHMVSGIWQGSTTVKMPISSQPYRKLKQGFINGDDFVFSVVTTSPVHRDGAPVGNIPEQDRTIKLELVTVDGERPVKLESRNGQSMTVSTYANSGTQEYRFQGTIAADNDVNGLVKVKVSLTSLLNLGGEDSQVDDSLTISIHDATPMIDQVVARNGAQSNHPVVYESETNRAKAVLLGTGDQYKVLIDVKFSRPMDTSTVVLSAGTRAPYEDFQVGLTGWSEKDSRFKGELEIPQSKVATGAAIVYLNISGESKENVPLDADPFTAGAQAETSHFVLLEMDEFYELSFSAESNAFTKPKPGRDLDARKTMRFNPVKVSVNLIPYRDHLNPKNQGEEMAKHFANVIDLARGKIKIFEEQIRFDEDRLRMLKDRPGKEIYDTGIARAKASLLKWKQELKQIQDHRIFVDAFVRICNGYKQYNFEPDISGVILGEFGGATWTDNSELTWRPGDRKRVSAKISADRWSTLADAAHLSWPTKGTMSTSESFQLSVWEFNPSDIKTIQNYLTAIPPESVFQTNGFAQSFQYGLMSLVQECWRHAAPKTEWPDWMTHNDPVQLLKPNATQVVMLPHLYGNHLGRLRLANRVFAEIPLAGSGQRVDEKYVLGLLTETKTTPISIHADGSTIGYRAIDDLENGPRDQLFGSDYRGGGRTSTRPGLTTGTVYAQTDWSLDNDQFVVYDYFQVGRPLKGSEFVRCLDDRNDYEWVRHDTYRWEVSKNGRFTVPRQDETKGVAASSPPSAQPSQLQSNGHAQVFLRGAMPPAVTDTRVTVFIDDRYLPSTASAVDVLSLADPRDTFRVISQKQSLVLDNDDRKPHTLSSRSNVLQIAGSTNTKMMGKVIAQGALHTLKPSGTGTCILRDAQLPDRRIKILVVPNDFYGIGQVHSVVVLNNIPPGTYTLRAVPVDPRLKPSLCEVKIVSNEVTPVGIEIIAR